MAGYYYENNPHLKYILYMYGLMVRRFDLEFAKQEIGLDSNSVIFQHYLKGKEALTKILENLGLGPNSMPMVEIWKQHLGLHALSTEQEVKHKQKVLKSFNRLQIHFVRQQVKDQILSIENSNSLRKM